MIAAQFFFQPLIKYLCDTNQNIIIMSEHKILTNRTINCIKNLRYMLKENDQAELYNDLLILGQLELNLHQRHFCFTHSQQNKESFNTDNFEFEKLHFFLEIGQQPWRHIIPSLPTDAIRSLLLELKPHLCESSDLFKPCIDFKKIHMILSKVKTPSQILTDFLACAGVAPNGKN